MYLRRLLIVHFLFLICCSAFAQQKGSSIYFERSQHNFGTVNERDGNLRHNFFFTNKGEDPLIVTSVETGAGISVLSWTKNPVMTGDSGNIILEINPVNMLGRFNRVVKVSSNGVPSSHVLRLLGEVVQRERTDEEIFPRKIGLLRLESSHISFGNIAPGSIAADSIEVFNPSGEYLDISFSGIPLHATVTANPSPVGPGEKGFIVATFNALNINDWGVVTDNFRILINGSPSDRNNIYLSANVQEDFSVLTAEDRASAPYIRFEERVFDFGKIMQGESVSYDFRFTNTGKSELIIRRIRSGCGCTVAEPDKTIINPGESGSINAVFNSRGFSGKQNKGITVITNAPANPAVVLRITGEVIAE